MGVGFFAGARLIREYLITAVAEAGGSAAGSGVYRRKNTVALTATPAADYRFVGWYDEKGNLISTANPFKFAATKEMTLRARFNLIMRNVSYSFNTYRPHPAQSCGYYHGITPKAVQVKLGVSIGSDYNGYQTQSFTSSGSRDFDLPAINGSRRVIRTVTVTFYSSYVSVSIPGPSDYRHDIGVTLVYE